MNKSLPVIRYERGYPLLACHVSGFLCLAAAQKIIIGCGSSGTRRTTMPKWDIIPRTRRGTPRRTANSPRLFLELFRKSPCGAAPLVSKSLTRDRERHDKYGGIMRSKTRRSSKRPACFLSFFFFFVRSFFRSFFRSFVRHHASRDYAKLVLYGKRAFRERVNDSYAQIVFPVISTYFRVY